MSDGMVGANEVGLPETGFSRVVKSAGDGAPLSRRSSVLALVPHFQCEEWLGDCLESLASQTLPLAGIAVIDDASGDPPTHIVREFSQVTLLKAIAAENVGPYRLDQQLINTTDYDGFLFQDADDWSSRDRLEILLLEAERMGAELIGSQEVRILCDEGEAVAFTYPLDANAALREQPTSFPLLHPTSLVSRDLSLRIGGFATGLRFGGDSEFLRRAAHAARVVNTPHFCYYRRIRTGSLTTDPNTGFQSVARRELTTLLHERARANAVRVENGMAPEIGPLAVAPPIDLTHVMGPALSWAA